ncbi:MAG TPA: aminotransferase class III-fold pyridoxal phosphate-dependent enzyme, partial [Actinomycetota bacterium]|nr:aminotransferase class III-fold pyridoxal phosphate-dependent enzyme [Actinomycetota bacterium]
PRDGFNQGLKDLCAENGALYISDEVMTGFRTSKAGWYGVDGVTPDLMTFGKVMGGGLPAAAFGGRAEVMAHLAPEGPVYQAGTLSGNPLATAAGLATLSLLDDAAYRHLDDLAATLADGLRDAFADAGTPARVQRAGNLFSVFMTTEEVGDYEAARRQDTAAYARFFHAMLDRGVYLPPSAFEAWFVSTVLTDAEVDRVLTAAQEAARLADVPAQPSSR